MRILTDAQATIAWGNAPESTRSQGDQYDPVLPFVILTAREEALLRAQAKMTRGDTLKAMYRWLREHDAIIPVDWSCLERGEMPE